MLDLHFMLTFSSEFDKSPTGLTLRLGAANDPQLRMQGPMMVQGPFIIIATSIQRGRTIALSEPAKDQPPAEREDAFLDFVILVDPKLAKYGMLGTPRFFSVDGWTVRQVVEFDSIWNQRSDSYKAILEWRYIAHRKLGKVEGSKSWTFKATAHDLHVTTKTTVWEVPDILKAKDTSKEITLPEGKRTYTIHEVKSAENKDFNPKADVYSIRLGVAGVGVSKGRWSGWPELKQTDLIDSFRLVDSGGRDYNPYLNFIFKGGAFAMGPIGLSGEYWSGRVRGASKQAQGAPAKALWTLPAEIRSVEIPIEFNSLPIP